MDKAKVIAIDIEAYRTCNPTIVERLSQQATDQKPSNNTKKELKAVWDRPETVNARIAEALAKTAVDPLLAEILCVDIYTNAGEHFTYSAMEPDTVWCLCMVRDTLEALMDADTVITGYNIKSYDLPLLLTEYQRHAVQPPEHYPVWTGRYWTGRVFDLLDRVGGHSGYGKKGDSRQFACVCEAFGIPAKTVLWNDTQMTGARVAAAYEAGEYALIEDYCRSDTEPTLKLYNTLTFHGNWGTYGDKAELREQIAEIEDSSDLSPGQKAIAQMQLVRSAGII